MAKKADIGGKRLIGLAPTAWVQWVTQQSHVVAQEILGSEFQWLSRDNNALVKVQSPMYGQFGSAIDLWLAPSARTKWSVGWSDRRAGWSDRCYSLRSPLCK